MNERKRKRERQHTNKERKRVSEHKSGDHVFNKGVKTIYYDIITESLKERGITHCHDDMTQTDTPELYNIFHGDKYWPLTDDIVRLLDETSVPSGKKDKPDDNSILFGEGKRCLVKGVVSILERVINMIKNRDTNEKFNELREHLKYYIQTNFTHERGGGDGFYVDPEAKERWLKQTRYDEEQFLKCKDAIKEIFDKLVDAEDNEPEKWFIYILANEIQQLPTLISDK